LGRHGLHRADEAGGIAGGEELLGVVAGAAAATEFLRGGKLHVERAVERGGGAVAAAGGLGGGFVEYFYGHGFLLAGVPVPFVLLTIEFCTIQKIVSAQSNWLQLILDRFGPTLQPGQSVP
jgi:hypothetical protein